MWIENQAWDDFFISTSFEKLNLLGCQAVFNFQSAMWKLQI